MIEMKGKTWDNKKSLMESHNKQFRRVNWTPECITQGEEGSTTFRDPWLFIQTNWKLSSNITFDLQQCTSMYVLRKAQEKCWKEKPSPQVVKLFEPHPGLAGCCTYIETQPSQSTLPWCSSHSKLANKTTQWDDRNRNHKPVLPIYLRLDVSNVLSRALSCLRLSGHNFLVQRMHHYIRSRRPYELRICDKCDWHSVQDEEHILLECCPHEHLVSTRTQHCQLVFPPQYEDSPTRLRTFLNQPNIYGVASLVAECLALFPWFVLISFWFGFRLFPNFRSDAPQRHI